MGTIGYSRCLQNGRHIFRQPVPIFARRIGGLRHLKFFQVSGQSSLCNDNTIICKHREELLLIAHLAGKYDFPQHLQTFLPKTHIRVSLLICLLFMYRCTGILAVRLYIDLMCYAIIHRPNMPPNNIYA